MVQPNRRQVLQGLTATGAVGLAGCAGLESGQQSTDGPATDGGSQSSPGEGDSGALPADGIAVALSIDQQRVAQKQSELSQQLKAGSITRKEAQTKLRDLQEQLAIDAADAFEQQAGDLEVAQRRVEQGAIVVTGPSEALIEALEFETVSALLSTDRLQR